MTEEELYAGAGEVARKCLDDILESEYGFVQDDEETYTSEYLLTYPCKTFAEGWIRFCSMDSPDKQTMPKKRSPISGNAVSSEG